MRPTSEIEPAAASAAPLATRLSRHGAITWTDPGMSGS